MWREQTHYLLMLTVSFLTYVLHGGFFFGFALLLFLWGKGHGGERRWDGYRTRVFWKFLLGFPISYKWAWHSSSMFYFFLREWLNITHLLDYKTPKSKLHCWPLWVTAALYSDICSLPCLLLMSSLQSGFAPTGVHSGLMGLSTVVFLMTFGFHHLACISWGPIALP